MISRSLLVGILFVSSLGYAQDPAPSFKNESEAGIVIVSGNVSSQSYNFKTANTYLWSGNSLKADARYLNTTNTNIEIARYWSLGLRYDRSLSDKLNVFLGELVESNIFSGFLQRYNTDLGAKWNILKNNAWGWSLEAGYRYSLENRLAASFNFQFLRAYTEATYAFNPQVGAKLWLEYLPNLTQPADQQLNTEASLTAALTEVFSTKVAYLVKYRSLQPAGITQLVDTWFTTSLVAKF